MINAIKSAITPTFLRENPVAVPTSLSKILLTNEVFTALFVAFEKLFVKLSTIFSKFSPKLFALFPILFMMLLKNSLLGTLLVIY
ncbi:hypothetical protein NY2A_b535R [Paramecium bursaria Chlorella virus NY2A]|uniref:Uncharacterized protein b535R n=1 Tax=Paramecium bursaria Chlorella virus NY2A TaxID=46021 RepID=A7IX60_PBCVN|nr:hypothetical protein NY2A_b535R [Paramecium bursaria Chlorella virus NY2A]ABT14934.1 hypothetical protein NY2A_b535R [Paramecium bursaria Chlorella virus NY2A]